MIGEITNTASLHWLEWNIHLEKDSSITTLDGEQSAKRSHVGSGEVALFYRGLNRPGVHVSKCLGVQMSRRSLMEVHWMEQAEQRASSPTPSLKKKMKREKRYTPSEAHSSLVFFFNIIDAFDPVQLHKWYVFFVNIHFLYEYKINLWSMKYESGKTPDQLLIHLGSLCPKNVWGNILPHCGRFDDTVLLNESHNLHKRIPENMQPTLHSHNVKR